MTLLKPQARFKNQELKPETESLTLQLKDLTNLL
jgi:hypothetical protein